MKHIQIICSMIVIGMLYTAPAFAHSGHHDYGVFKGILHVLTSIDHLLYLAVLVGAGVVFIARRPLSRLLRVIKTVRSN